MILIVSERKIGKKKFLSQKNEILSKSRIFTVFDAKYSKMTKKVCKLFFRQPLKIFLLVKWPYSRYWKGVFLLVLYVGKTIMVIGFVDQNIFQKMTPQNPCFWGGYQFKNILFTAGRGWIPSGAAQAVNVPCCLYIVRRWPEIIK